MVPLAAIGCGSAAQQVQTTSPTPSGAPPAGSPAQSQRPFLEALTSNGDTTTFQVLGAPAGTRCAGTVSWTRGSRTVVRAHIAGASPPSPITFRSDTPPDGITVTWSVDCSLGDRSQHLQLTATGPTTGSSARNAQP